MARFVHRTFVFAGLFSSASDVARRRLPAASVGCTVARDGSYRKEMRLFYGCSNVSLFKFCHCDVLYALQFPDDFMQFVFGFRQSKCLLQCLRLSYSDKINER